MSVNVLEGNWLTDFSFFSQDCILKARYMEPFVCVESTIPKVFLIFERCFKSTWTVHGVFGKYQTHQLSATLDCVGMSLLECIHYLNEYCFYRLELATAMNFTRTDVSIKLIQIKGEKRKCRRKYIKFLI